MKQLDRLERLLQQIRHDAGFALLYRDQPAVRAFCVVQFNRVGAALCAVSPRFQDHFAPLPKAASAAHVRIAARDLIWEVRQYRRHEAGPAAAQNLLDCLLAPFALMLEEAC